MDVRPNIAAYLRDKGIKQRYIAQGIGVSESKISKILNRKMPMDSSLFLDLCVFVNESPEYLMNYQKQIE